MDSLFLNIMNNAIVASLLIVAIIILRLVFKKLPKWLHCLLWGLVAIKLLVPVNIESPFGFLPTRPIPENIVLVETDTVDTGVSDIAGGTSDFLAEDSGKESIKEINVVSMRTPIYIASIVWIAGLIIMLAYFAGSFLMMKRRVAASIAIGHNAYECDDIASPFILGLIAPKIYLPSGLGEGVKECVLAHENAHISRCDFLWKPLGFVILAVYWFNPLCWISYILLCRDIEYACDEKTTKDKDDSWRANYCQALLDCSIQQKMITACPVAFGEVSVKERVIKVINYKKPAFWGIVAAAVVCVVVAVCFMTSSNRPGLFESVPMESVEVMEVTEDIATQGDEYVVEKASLTMEPEDTNTGSELKEDDKLGDDKSNDDKTKDGEVIVTIDESGPSEIIASRNQAGWVWPTLSKVVAWRFDSGEEAGVNIAAKRINIGAGLGDEVYSASDGTVLKAEFDADEGNYIEILSSDGYYFKYSHLSEMKVSAGDTLNPGDVIGNVGNTGKTTGPNLAFSMYEQQGSELVYLDPMKFFVIN